MAGVKVKGQAFVGFQSSIVKLRGADAMKTVRRRLPEELSRALTDGEIVSIGWYPIEWYAALQSSARRAFGDEISKEVARDAARSDVTSIYRFILKFFSPETLMNQSARVFRLFCDGGRCTVPSSSETRARIEYTDCEGANRGFWDNIIGGSETLVELCGGTDVETRIQSGGSDKDSSLRCDMVWKLPTRRNATQ